MRFDLTTSLPVVGMALAAALAAGCSPSPSVATAQTPEVSVLRAKSQVLPLTRDLVGRVAAVRIADVRARVPGDSAQTPLQGGH